MQLASCEGRQNLLDVATGLRDHVDPGRRQRHLQRPGDRAADQQVGPGLGETSRPKLRVFGIKGDILARVLDPVAYLDDQHVAGDVEDGTDPALPMGYRELHFSRTIRKFCATAERKAYILFYKQLTRTPFSLCIPEAVRMID